MDSIKININGFCFSIKSDNPILTNMLLSRYKVFIDYKKEDYSLILINNNKKKHIAPFIFKKRKYGFYTQHQGYSVRLYKKEATIEYNNINKEKKFYFFLIQNAIYLILMLYSQDKTFFPLHSSSIILNKNAILFSGPSGRGKTTIARLSRQTIFSDDSTLIVLDMKKICASSFERAYVKYKTKELFPIKRLFFINHGNKNVVYKLDKKVTLRKLMLNNFFFSASKYPTYVDLEDNNLLYKKIFKLADIISDNLTGYELFFKKSNEISKKLPSF